MHTTLDRLQQIVQPIQVNDNHVMLFVHYKKLAQIKQILGDYKPLLVVVTHISIAVRYNVEEKSVNINFVPVNDSQVVLKVFKELAITPEQIEVHDLSIEFMPKPVLAAIYQYIRSSNIKLATMLAQKLL